MKSFHTLINHYSKIWANIFYFQKNEVKPTFIYKIRAAEVAISFRQFLEISP